MFDVALPPGKDSLKASLAAALILAVGAGGYAVAEGPGGTFDATPLAIGVILMVAGSAGRRSHFWPSGLVLTGWGAAVLLIHYQTVPGDRITSTYMLGVGVGLLAVRAVAPRADRGAWLSTAVVSATTGPLAYYVAFDVSSVGRWPLWFVTTLVWAAGDAAATLIGSAPRIGPHGAAT